MKWFFLLAQLHYFFSQKDFEKSWISGYIYRGKFQKSANHETLKLEYVRAIRAISSEAPASQLSFFDLNPPPHSSTQAGDEENSDSELSLESSMESLTLLGQEDTPLKNSVQSQVSDLIHKVHINT